MSSDGCAAESELLPVFKQLAKKATNLTLSNSYHGMEWFQDSRILAINHEYAVMKVKDCKTFAAPGVQIQLHNSAFRWPVRATVQDLDYDCGLVYLSEIAYFDRDWQNRYHERVQPKNPSYAILSFNRRNIRACIENISLNGQGLLVDGRCMARTRIRTRSKVSLKFDLPPRYQWNCIKGVVVNLTTINNCLVRLGIRLYPDALEARALINYVTARKQEILEELDQDCLDKIASRGVEKLYF